MMKARSATTSLRRAVRLAGQCLREIFDEAAYGRYLERTRQEPSRQAYAGFLKEREKAPARPRCC